MPGHALADRGERTAGDLPDEIQDPFAHLAEQGRRPAGLARPRDVPPSETSQQPRVHQRRVGAGIAYPFLANSDAAPMSAGSAVADRHGPAIGCGDEDPDHPRDDQQKPGVLPSQCITDPAGTATVLAPAVSSSRTSPGSSRRFDFDSARRT